MCFAQPAQDLAIAEYHSTVRETHERVRCLTEAMRKHLEHRRMPPVIESLMSLRAIEVIGAATLVAEIGDFTRFAWPRELMYGAPCP